MPITNVTSKWVAGALVFEANDGTDLVAIADRGITVSADTTISGDLAISGALSGDGLVQSVVVEATLTEVNAGKTLIAGVTGKTITILDYTMLFDGAFEAATSVDLDDTNGTPVSICALAVAGATDGAVIKPDHTNITNGAGYLAELTAGKGVAIGKTGSSATTGTKVTVAILYSIA